MRILSSMLYPSVMASAARMGMAQQKAFEISENALIRHVRYAFLGNNNDVSGGREPGFVKTEEFPESSL